MPNIMPGNLHLDAAATDTGAASRGRGATPDEGGSPFDTIFQNRLTGTAPDGQRPAGDDGKGLPGEGDAAARCASRSGESLTDPASTTVVDGPVVAVASVVADGVVVTAGDTALMQGSAALDTGQAPVSGMVATAALPVIDPLSPGMAATTPPVFAASTLWPAHPSVSPLTARTSAPPMSVAVAGVVTEPVPAAMNSLGSRIATPVLGGSTAAVVVSSMDAAAQSVTMQVTSPAARSAVPVPALAVATVSAEASVASVVVSEPSPATTALSQAAVARPVALPADALKPATRTELSPPGGRPTSVVAQALTLSPPASVSMAVAVRETSAQPEAIQDTLERLVMNRVVQHSMSQEPVGDAVGDDTAPVPDTLSGLATSASRSTIMSTSLNGLALSSVVGQPAWSGELGQRMTQLVQQNITEAQLQLNPKHLGPMEIRVTYQHDQINIAFTAQNAVTREALDAALPRLRDMLGDLGMNLGQVSVSQDPGFAMRQQGQGGSGTGRNAGLVDGPAVDDVELRAPPPHVAQGLVDFYA